MRRITDYQQGLFEEILAPIDDSSHVYRYGNFLPEYPQITQR